VTNLESCSTVQFHLCPRDKKPCSNPELSVQSRVTILISHTQSVYVGLLMDWFHGSGFLFPMFLPP
jgi:hypothetical protein